MTYIDLNYQPRESDLLVWFRAEPPAGKDMKYVADRIAEESSIGTWTDLKTLLPEIWEKLRARVYEIDEKNKYVKIAYPLHLFEIKNMPAILASVAGNVFGMKSVEALRVLDIRFPKELIQGYLGPKYGVQGVREMTKVYDRPFLGTIIKPKIGLPAKMHAEVAYEAWVGGLDIVKDDENLASQEFNRFEERLALTLEKKDIAEEETGEKKIYLVNITAPYKEMIRRAELVQDSGNEFVMIDVFISGFSAVQSYREEGFKMAIHAHRAMHAAITRNPEHGINMLTLAKVYRLLGVDNLHIGTAVGKMEGSAKEVSEIREEIQLENVPANESRFEQKWYEIKPVLAVASGGLHPGHVPAVVDILGKDIVIQAGGGVHGHPEGTRAGAKAMREALEAKMQGIPLEEYAKEHKELREALEKFLH
ncbi:type III ribulose-bisphosphate carboxylase [Candidatus Aciduliprofundum boonei]|uniref:Ribulose bisphosphate carboxylase n=1 Tax=Aciduliprofundum boonei (strain DSM 19572 / T469) TaxID=439481 RepID=B5IH56_ACIB4|nr:type III ribulose-bisphosphate carboxylase [Candidatus Aciduliprofundum boonei]ADD08893.1 ribulose bisphosphate carboxylase, type III [Aciduliprofundum boonei T469]EDY34409.1 ribulose bisphosphate carboxylase, type III [Aciduliprofundum boonei T469]HII54792.1 type III ribulose-bisphosphate carboxylase [Candidatus Aciduliprofundum boonei]